MGSGVWTQNKILSKEIIDFHPTREKAIIEEAKLIHENYHHELNRNFHRPYKTTIENSMSEIDKRLYEKKWLKQMEKKRLEKEKKILNDPVRIKKENDKKQRLIVYKENQRLKDIRLTKQKENETLFNTFLANNIEHWCHRIKAVFGVVITDVIDTPFFYIRTNNPVMIIEDIKLGKPPSSSQVIKDLFNHINENNITHKVTLKLIHVIYDNDMKDWWNLLKSTETEALNTNFNHRFEVRRTHILNNINKAINTYVSQY